MPCFTLLEKSSLKIDSRDVKGRTPLHYAVLYNNHKAVKVGHIDFEHFVHKMVLCLMLWILQLLLINGASPEAQDNEGKTPMDLPHSYNVIVDDDIIEMLEAGEKHYNFLIV